MDARTHARRTDEGWTDRRDGRNSYLDFHLLLQFKYIFSVLRTAAVLNFLSYSKSTFVCTTALIFTEITYLMVHLLGRHEKVTHSILKYRFNVSAHAHHCIKFCVVECNKLTLISFRAKQKKSGSAHETDIMAVP